MIYEKRLTHEQLKVLYDLRPVATSAKILMITALLAAAMAVSWKTHSGIVRWTAYLAGGYLWMSIVTFMHEATHYTLFNTKWKNTAYGVISMIPLMVSYTPFKEDHIDHHRYNRTSKDPDAFTMGKRGVLDFVAFYLYIVAGGALTFLHFNFIYPIKRFDRKLWARHIAELALRLAFCWALVTWAKQQDLLGPVLRVWLMPIFFFTLLNSMRFLAEHYGTPWDSGKLAGTRTIKSNRLHSFFWNNINWHIGHHQYPRVPGYNLVKLHAMVESEVLALGAVVDKSYTRVFLNALISGPETRERLQAGLQRRRERQAAEDFQEPEEPSLVPVAI